jgi:hypothetical protein
MAPVKLLPLGDFVTPKAVIMRVGAKRREDVTALPALKDVDTAVVENRPVTDTAAQQALQGFYPMPRARSLFRASQEGLARITANRILS